MDNDFSTNDTNLDFDPSSMIEEVEEKPKEPFYEKKLKALIWAGLSFSKEPDYIFWLDSSEANILSNTVSITLVGEGRINKLLEIFTKIHTINLKVRFNEYNLFSNSVSFERYNLWYEDDTPKFTVQFTR